MSLLLKALSMVAPARCLVCGLEGHELCPSCAQELANPLPERCFRCQKLSSGSKTCSTCRRYAPLKNVWVYGEYENSLKDAIKAFKFERQRALAGPLAEILCDPLPALKQPPIIVHVPTATTRLRARGYDHGELLARELSRITGYKHVPALRRQNQARQVGAKRQTRLTQLEGAFRVIRNEYIRGQDILIIDDVVTTGSTLSVCSKLLKVAGARTISALVLAQNS